ncbi:MAG: hypothetical protein GY869_26525 [Planctomycetes bacterium]|nr:hypothetical protein [Planctomycetota bacterium]
MRKYFVFSIVWQIPKYDGLRRLLKHPIYAGVYVYGRTQTVHEYKDGAIIKRTSNHLPFNQCKVFIKDHHEAYVDWDEFLEIQTKISQNRPRWKMTENLCASLVHAGPYAQGYADVRGRVMDHGLARGRILQKHLARWKEIDVRLDDLSQGQTRGGDGGLGVVLEYARDILDRDVMDVEGDDDVHGGDLHDLSRGRILGDDMALRSRVDELSAKSSLMITPTSLRFRGSSTWI